jgi:rubredoxin
MAMERYFVDERSGCIAVRDRTKTAPDYNGLHADTEGVVKYWEGIPVRHVCPTCGHTEGWGYTVPETAIEEARGLCDSLNQSEPNAELRRGSEPSPPTTC